MKNTMSPVLAVVVGFISQAAVVLSLYWTGYAVVLFAGNPVVDSVGTTLLNDPFRFVVAPLLGALVIVGVAAMVQLAYIVGTTMFDFLGD